MNSENNKVYFITGGGTGGHIYPAVAVADELLRDNGDANIFYVGNPNNLESEIVKNKNYTFLPVTSSGMPRKISFALLDWTFRMLYATLKCCFYIYKRKPDLIFGTGGYVSAPVLAAGMIMKVPFVMHDCDANPGLVTRLLAPFAKSISVAFECAKDKLANENCYVNGNPIRSEFSKVNPEIARNKLNLDTRLTLCVMGGSQGSKTISNAVTDILKTLSQSYNIQIIFQTGKKNYDEVIAKLKEIYPEFEQDKNLMIRPYFNNMVTILAASDIAISRAGSLSISELCASSVAPIFIPYPYAAADHQRKNAKFMLEHGACLYLEDEETNSENLLKLLKGLIANTDKIEKIKQAASSLARYDGVYKIVEQIKKTT